MYLTHVPQEDQVGLSLLTLEQVMARERRLRLGLEQPEQT